MEYGNDIENILCRQVIDGEVLVSETNNQDLNDEFEACVDLLDAERREKDYDWMSDIRIPEFASHMLTQSSLDVAQYFQTREFVTAYLEEGSDIAKANAEGATELINRTLNQKHMHHYMKFVRGKGINNVTGQVYAKCWWEQETVEDNVTITRYEEEDFDEFGDPIESDEQVAAVRQIDEVIPQQKVVIDRFNYDIWDQRNVFCDSTYTYSIQDKRWITFLSEKTISELEQDGDRNGYFNLDKLGDIRPPTETKFKASAENKDRSETPVTSAIEQPYDVYERYGKHWELNGKIGIGKDGKPLDKAKYVHVIITIAASNDKKMLIGFKKTPFIDAHGVPFIPALRGICYINLTEDHGLGDGKYAKELQIAIDDTFNVAQDRTMLATLPVFTTDKSESDNSEIYLEPGHNIPLTDPKTGIYEFKISSDTVGALNQISVLSQKMQQADSIQPPQMGDTGQASTTATAFAGAFRATGERSNYKSLTFENTFLSDLYWMIQQMTFRFAMEETGFKLMGEKVYDFDPTKDYYYKPLSQTIEPEYSKAAKRKEWSTVLGYAAQIPHKDTVKLVNFAFSQFVKLMGDEYTDFADMLLDEKQPIENQQGGQQMVAGAGGVPVSNQNLLPQSAPEQDARGLANVGVF